MPADTHDALLSVVDLVDRPGASRPLALRLAVPDDLELTLARLDSAIHLDGVVECVVDGILVRGAVSVDAELACARCLASLPTTLGADVAELYRDPADVAPEDDALEPGYEVLEGQLSLDPLLRDAIVPTVPYAPLCRADCAGLCAMCGVDRNTVDCDCVQVSDDPRWAALADLELPDER